MPRLGEAFRSRSADGRAVALSGVAEAIAALRAGRPVTVGALTIAGVETATSELLSLLDPEQAAPILLSGERAAALGLGNVREAADPASPVLISRATWLSRDQVLRLVDPASDFSRFSEGPLEPVPIDEQTSASAAITLARLAGLMPALWVLRETTTIAVDVEAVAAASQRSAVTIAARARLPVAGPADTQIVVFRADEDGSEHVALVIGAPGGKPPLIRLHSECLTGDVFGSLKCDCGPQLHAALRLIAEAGGGVLLYLRQEGRGIGLANKIRAYALQDRGLDTVEANRRLGFADDARDYGLAAGMLQALGISRVRLLTNNPGKLRGLERAGIEVVERVAHHMPANPHNADYLATKRKKSGHLD